MFLRCFCAVCLAITLVIAVLFKHMFIHFVLGHVVTLVSWILYESLSRYFAA